MEAEYHDLSGEELKKFFLSRIEAITAGKPAFGDSVAHFGAKFDCRIRWLNTQADAPREVQCDSAGFDLDGHPTTGEDLIGIITVAAMRALENHPDLNPGICHHIPTYTVELTVTAKAVRLKKGQSVAALEEPIVDAKGERLEPHSETYNDQGTITLPDKIRENIGLPLPGQPYSASEVGAANVK